MGTTNGHALALMAAAATLRDPARGHRVSRVAEETMPACVGWRAACTRTQ